MNQHVSTETIERRIFVIRGLKVMLDRDLAELYGVETGQLKRAVRRNIDRFPDDFMFELSKGEYEDLRCQSGTLRWGEHAKYPPFAFTEQGVAMLSSVLSSKRAIQINVQIMRAFVRVRQIVQQSHEIQAALQKMEKRLDGHDNQIRVAFDALKSLMGQPLTVKVLPPPLEYPPPGLWPYKKDERKRMGFAPGKKDGPGTKARAARGAELPGGREVRAMNKKHIGSSFFNDVKEWEKSPTFRGAVEKRKQRAHARRPRTPQSAA
jgi:phage regulator Rha-like protein